MQIQFQIINTFSIMDSKPLCEGCYYRIYDMTTLDATQHFVTILPEYMMENKIRKQYSS